MIGGCVVICKLGHGEGERSRVSRFGRWVSQRRRRRDGRLRFLLRFDRCILWRSRGGGGGDTGDAALFKTECTICI